MSNEKENSGCFIGGLMFLAILSPMIDGFTEETTYIPVTIVEKRMDPGWSWNGSWEAVFILDGWPKSVNLQDKDRWDSLEVGEQITVRQLSTKIFRTKRHFIQ